MAPPPNQALHALMQLGVRRLVNGGVGTTVFLSGCKAIAAPAAIAGRARFEEADFQVDDRLRGVEGDDFGLDSDLVAGLQLSAELVDRGLPPSDGVSGSTTG
jgi:hypothetical protein